MDRSYVTRNDAGRARLAQLLDRLSDRQMDIVVDGWPIRVHLAHLAFWDRFTLLRWRETVRSGRPVPVSVGDPLTDLINDAQLAQWAALGTTDTRAQVTLAAAECDAHVATLPDDLVRAAQDAGLDRNLDRSVHRERHLGPVETALAAGG